MNYIDMFILVLLVYAAFRGFTQGLIMQLTLVIALLLGIFGALKLSGYTAEQLDARVDIDPEYLYIVALTVTFTLMFVGVYLVGKFAEKLVQAAQLSFLNRLTGVFFSVAKIILITGLLLSYIDGMDRHFHFLPEGSREHSLFFRPFTGFVRTVFPAIKHHLQEGEKGGTDLLQRAHSIQN
jgi:membrane protein required for colicin V production